MVDLSSWEDIHSVACCLLIIWIGTKRIEDTVMVKTFSEIDLKRLYLPVPDYFSGFIL